MVRHYKRKKEKQLSGRSPNEACVPRKMGGYLARCRGNASSPRHQRVSQSGDQLAEHGHIGMLDAA